MGIKTGVFVTLFAVFSGWECGAQDTVDLTKSAKQVMQEINSRYDDFFKYQNYLQERLERLQSGRNERQERERKHALAMEQARQRLVKERKAKPSDEVLRLRWEAEQKERAQHNELLRRRYVERRDYFEDYLKKGRQIPEMKEYGLEDY